MEAYKVVAWFETLAPDMKPVASFVLEFFDADSLFAL